MPRTTDEQRDYMRAWRADPRNAAVSRWQSRTTTAAMRELARRRRAEFQAILWEIRQMDPRPCAGEEEVTGSAAWQLAGLLS